MGRCWVFQSSRVRLLWKLYEHIGKIDGCQGSGSVTKDLYMNSFDLQIIAMLSIEVAQSRRTACAAMRALEEVVEGE